MNSDATMEFGTLIIELVITKLFALGYNGARGYIERRHMGAKVHFFKKKIEWYEK